MRTVILVFAASMSLACVRTATNEGTGEIDVDLESPGQEGEDWNATLSGQGMGSGITGSSRALVADGMTTVRINIMGATPGASHPWHVHDGACNSGGGIVGPASAYGSLRVGDDGRAADDAELSLQLDEAKDYHVNVHASSMNMATIIACGDLDD
ncbi:MAG: hypothetical protein ACRENI_00620 [Gemmatimonadaceae bacterium]